LCLIEGGMEADSQVETNSLLLKNVKVGEDETNCG
jgi:hypothetical protein